MLDVPVEVEAELDAALDVEAAQWLDSALGEFQSSEQDDQQRVSAVVQMVSTLAHALGEQPPQLDTDAIAERLRSMTDPDEPEEEENAESDEYQLALDDSGHDDLADPVADDIAETAARELGTLTARLRREFLAIFRTGDPWDQIRRAREFLAEHHATLAQALSDTQIAATVAGMKKVIDRMPAEAALPRRTLPPSEPPLRGEGAAAAPEPLIRFPIIDEAVNDLQGRRVLLKAEYDALTAQAKADAFTVAGVETEKTLEKIQNAMVDTTRTGGTQAEFEANVEAAVGSGTFLSPAHAENVFRTNIQAAYSSGLDKALAHPLVNALFPYEQYVAVHESGGKYGTGRTRPEHLALEKMGIQGTNIYRRDDPVYQKYKPPWDFQ